MRKMWLGKLLLAVGMIILGLACEGENPVAPSEEFAPPTNLTYITDSSSVTLMWNHSPDNGLDDFLGYFVYVAESSIVSLGADSLLDPYKANREPVTDNSYSVGGLTRGQRYYFHVRAVKGPDTLEYTLSNPTNEVHTSPVLIGTGTLYEFSSPLGNPSGYDFSGSRAYFMVHDNANYIDIYLGTTEEDDGAGDLTLKSPHIVQSTHPEWESRISYIKSLGTGWDNYNQTADDFSTPEYHYERVYTGRVYAIKTPDNHFVKLEVTGTSGTFPNRTVTFRYAYQEITGYGHFK